MKHIIIILIIITSTNLFAGDAAWLERNRVVAEQRRAAEIQRLKEVKAKNDEAWRLAQEAANKTRFITVNINGEEKIYVAAGRIIINGDKLTFKNIETHELKTIKIKNGAISITEEK